MAALIAATLASFLTPFMGSATNVALPSLGQDFAMNAVLLSWVQTSYLLAAAMFLVPFGRISDIFGRKKIFMYGTALFTLASLLTGLAPSAAVLLVGRVAQGIGSAMIFGTSIAILTSVFPAEERGRVLGINVAFTYTGLSVGPFLGGLLTENLGWRSIFYAMVPLGLIVVVFTLWRLKGEWAEARGQAFDWAGSVVYALALVALMYGFSVLPGSLGAGLVAAGVVGLGIFVAWELRSSAPVLDIHLFANNRPFAFSNLAALINYSATSAVAFLLSLYLQYIKALTPEQAGLVLIAQPVVQAAFSPLAGRLSDRIEPRIVASVGMGFTALGLGLLVIITAATPLWAIVVRLLLLGFGFALFSSPNMNAIMGSVERQFYGIASGTLATMRLVGQMFSQGIATLLFALYIGRVQISPELYPLFLTSAKTAFVIFAALCVAGIFASLARGKIRDWRLEIGDWRLGKVEMREERLISNIQYLIVDMDGVLYRGNQAIPGTAGFLAFLRRRGIQFVLATNNSTRTPQQYVDKLAGMGVTVQPGEILTSAQATASYLAGVAAEGTRVFVVGQDGLRAALREAGFAVVEDEPEFVVAGMDFTVCYERLAQATLHIRAGARFVGTNPDKTFPSEQGIVPGAGALLAFLEAATGVTPTVIGKPETAMMDQALACLGAERDRTAVLGDRLETDILAGRRAGLATLLVLSGITSRAMLDGAEIQPDLVFEDVGDLTRVWEGVLGE
jgi:HAD superfamily hydrolase (TIGR01457 family)